MHLPRAFVLASLFALAFAAPQAAAQSPGTISGPEAMSVMKALGLSPELGPDNFGDPQIKFQQNELDCMMSFYDCRNGRCGSLQLVVALDLVAGTTFQVINRYNRRFRYGRAYLDDEMDPFLLYDIDVPHSHVDAYLERQLGTFGRLLESLTEAVDF